MSIRIPGLKPPPQKQGALIITEDGRVVKSNLDVLIGCIADHEHKDAWILDIDNQLESREDRRNYQIVCERTAAPIAVTGVSNLKLTQATVTAIADATDDAEKQEIEKKSLRDKYLQWVIILVGAPVLLALILITWVVFQRWQAG